MHTEITLHNRIGLLASQDVIFQSLLVSFYLKIFHFSCKVPTFKQVSDFTIHHAFTWLYELMNVFTLIFQFLQQLCLDGLLILPVFTSLGFKSLSYQD